MDPYRVNLTGFRYFMSKELADMLISCNDEEFPAHRIILGAQTPFFERALATDWSEEPIKSIAMNDTTRNAVFSMLAFCYTGDYPARAFSSDLDIPKACKLNSPHYLIDKAHSLKLRTSLSRRTPTSTSSPLSLRLTG